MSGLSATRLRRLHAVMAGYVERGEVPGLVTLISRHGETHLDAIGSLAVDGPPVRTDSIFRISSMTKPVLAAATLLLLEECLLRLDDPVEELLPELADRQVLVRPDAELTDTVPAERPITVRDLLTFRMGTGIVMAPPGSLPIQAETERLSLGQGPPNPDTTPEPDEWLRRLGTLPLLHQPGAKWMYNTSADVLGILIARACGRPLDEVLHERIFAPLGLTDTAFHVPPDKIDRLATAYHPGPLTVTDPAEGGQWSRPPAFPSGGGGLVSTAGDYLAFATMLLRDGGGLLSRPSVRAMTTNQLTPAQRAASGLYPGQFDDQGWGFGLAVTLNRAGLASTPGRYGWDGGLGTSWANDPAEDLTGILLTQLGWASPTPPPVCQDFWTSIYQAIVD